MTRCKCLNPVFFQSGNLPVLFSPLLGFFSKFLVMFSCFFASVSCVSTFFNQCAMFCLSGRTHFPFQNFTLSWLPGLMSFFLFFFSILFQPKIFAWFVRNILFRTYCSALASYLFNLAEAVSTLYLSSSITTFSNISVTISIFQLFLYCFLIKLFLTPSI